jgi:preprotein translocase subunit SecE
MARVSPAQFVREVRQELTKVTWPSRRELIFTTASVLVMSAAAALFFFLVDQIIAWGVSFIFGLTG